MHCERDLNCFRETSASAVQYEADVLVVLRLRAQQLFYFIAITWLNVAA